MISHTTNKILATRFLSFLVLAICLGIHVNAQSLAIVSGNGQMVNSPSYLSSVPLVVQVNSASGKPLPGVAITWAITTGNGTLPDATTVTDASGQASTHFTTSALQPQQSFLENVVKATSKYGSVSFFVIAVPSYNSDGSQAEPPSVTLLKPTPGATLTASPGSTLPDAVEVKVQAGYGANANAPIPNVSIHIVNGLDPTKPATAHCNGPNGYLYTDSNGLAKCDLVVTGQPGTLLALGTNAGEYHTTPTFALQISSSPACTYSISPTSQAIPAAGGTGSVKVTTAASCGWAATSNADWITITSGASGTGNGTVDYSVGADASTARSGTLTIAGQTFTVNEGSGNGTLTITTPANLPGGSVNQSYSTTLAASGGIAPYAWSVTSGALPAGLSLNGNTGLISGVATAAGTATFTATVQDNKGTTASLIFTLTITTASSSFVFTNTSFPNGIVDVAYTQKVTTSGGAVTPFFPNPAIRVSNGALPDGLNLVRNSDGSYSIAGTPSKPGLFDFTLTASDAAGNVTAANLTITITGTPTQEKMAVNPATLSFTVQLGSANTPVPQPLSVTADGAVLSYTSVVSTDTGGSWLVSQNPAGNTPGTITVSITNYSNLPAGTYTGTVTVSSAAANSPIAVPVSLTILAVPSLMVTPSQITLSQGTSAGSNPTSQSLQVTTGTSQAQDTTSSIGFSAAATANQGGTWLSVSPAVATTPATLTVTIDSGGLAIGVYHGAITVTPTAGSPQTVPVTLNVINPQMLSAAPAPIAFKYTAGSETPAAQSVTVSSSTGPPLTLSAAVSTTDKGNWLFVNPTGGATPLDLSVSVNPTGLAPNTYSGTITVTASDDSVTPLPIPVTLTVTPAGPNIDAVVNAASFVAGAVAPGEFVTIFGSQIGPDTPVAWTGGPIVRTLGDTQVFFDGFSAPILYTSSGQVSAIVPYALAASSATKLTVWYKGKASASDDLKVADAAPGIFMLNTAGQGAIVNQDGTINSATNGAPIGSTVSIYATGEGQTNPPGVTGSITGGTPPFAEPQLTVTAQVGGLPAFVTYAGAAPFEPAGFMQVNVTIPTGVATGPAIPVVMTVGTAFTQKGVTISIHP